MTQHYYKTHVTVLSVLGFVGYVLAACQWLVVIAISLPAVLNSPLGDILMPKGTPPPTPTPPPEIPASAPAEPLSGLAVVVLTTLALGIVAAVAYVVVVRYTRAITKTTSEVTHAVTKRAVPVLARKPVEQIAPQKRTVLTRRILFWLKFALTITPTLLMGVFWYPHHTDAVGQVTMLVSAVLALIALSCFLAQAVLATRWHIRSADVR